MGCDSDGFVDVAQSILRHYFVFRSAKDNADGGTVVRMPQLSIHCREVEVHLTCVLRGKLPDFQVYNDVAAQFEMVEKHVHLKLISADIEAIGAADEREAFAEFEQKLLDVVDQSVLQLALTGIFVQHQEVG